MSIELTGSVQPLLAHASLGGPVEVLRELEQRVDSRLNALSASARNSGRNQWIWRSAALAYPDFSMRALQAPEAMQSPGAALTVAATANNANAVRDTLLSRAQSRRGVRPQDVMFDGLYSEVAALEGVGDHRAAIDWIDPYLNALRYSTSRDLAQIPRAGSLVRCMVLRARLGKIGGDSATAKRWANAVIALWSQADPFLQITVVEMKSIAR